MKVGTIVRHKKQGFYGQIIYIMIELQFTWSLPFLKHRPVCLVEVSEEDSFTYRWANMVDLKHYYDEDIDEPMPHQVTAFVSKYMNKKGGTSGK